MVGMPDAPVGCAACGLGNPRDSRLEVLRYEKPSTLLLHLNPMDACKAQSPTVRLKLAVRGAVQGWVFVRLCSGWRRNSVWPAG